MEGFRVISTIAAVAFLLGVVMVGIVVLATSDPLMIEKREGEKRVQCGWSDCTAFVFTDGAWELCARPAPALIDPQEIRCEED